MPLAYAPGGDDSEVAQLRSKVLHLEKDIRDLQGSSWGYRQLFQATEVGLLRFECSEPIALDLPLDEKVEMLLQKAQVVEANDSMAARRGAGSVCELIGRTLNEVLPSPEVALEYFSGEAWKTDEIVRNIRPNGVYGVTQDGALLGGWYYERELGKRNSAPNERSFQEGFLRRVLEAIPGLVFVKDEEGTYVLANAATARLYGTDVAELEGKKDEDFRSREESEFFRSIDRKVLETHLDVGPYEMCLESAQGENLWFHSSKHLIPSHGGRSLVLGVCTDITERKKAELELATIRRAIDSAGDAMTITDLDGRTTYANQAFTRMFGYDVESLNAEGGTTALYSDPQERSLVVNSVNTQHFFEGEVTLRHRDGSTRLVSQRVDLVFASDGTRAGILGVRSDVGERRRMEAQMRQSEKLAALGELVAGVAHEINNPLATISINAQMLRRSEDPQVQQRAEAILRMVDRATRIGRSLTSFAREMPRNPSSLPINELVATAVELCAPSVRQAGVALSLNLAEEQPLAHVDESQIEQVVLNLVSNALHAMRGEARKELRICTSLEQDWSVISVGDTGPGIPEEIREKVFEPFFSTKAVGEGTGLGLPICHGIAEAHRGSLTFECHPGGGTTFYLRLPRRLDD